MRHLVDLPKGYHTTAGGSVRTAADSQPAQTSSRREVNTPRRLPGSQRIKNKERPRRAGRSPGWPEVWHPVDLPEGYHTTTRGQSFTMLAGGCVEGCPRVAAR